jgi:UDP-N-acetylmuramoyl-tripeptide--D-alanyl-D-alanine ligase
LPASRRGAHAPDSQTLIPAILGELRPGDVLLVKGSLGTKMAPIIEALLRQDEQAKQAAGSRPRAANGR